MVDVQTRTKRTPEKVEERQDAQKGKFLTALAKSCNVSYACKAARVGRSTVYEWRDADLEFAKAWDEAEQTAVEGLEREAWRRAQDGVKRKIPHYAYGKEVGHSVETVYSDTLMIFLLKAHAPAKYRETVNMQVSGANGAPIVREVIVNLAVRGAETAGAVEVGNSATDESLGTG